MRPLPDPNNPPDIIRVEVDRDSWQLAKSLAAVKGQHVRLWVTEAIMLKVESDQKELERQKAAVNERLAACTT